MVASSFTRGLHSPVLEFRLLGRWTQGHTEAQIAFPVIRRTLGSKRCATERRLRVPAPAPAQHIATKHTDCSDKPENGLNGIGTSPMTHWLPDFEKQPTYRYGRLALTLHPELHGITKFHLRQGLGAAL
jgi:hypothetical protein